MVIDTKHPHHLRLRLTARTCMSKAAHYSHREAQAGREADTDQNKCATWMGIQKIDRTGKAGQRDGSAPQS